MKNFLRKIFTKYFYLEIIWLKLQWFTTKIAVWYYTDLEYSMILWKRHTKNDYDFKNPKTLDQKTWFLKLSNRDELLTICSDKHRVREYIRKCGYDHILKKEYYCFKNADAIDFSKLPSPCYLKCNHASGMNLIYRKENKINEKHIKWKFNYLLKQNPYYLSREWNYKNIEPLIICEEVLSMPDGQSEIPEIQFFCFYGNPQFLIYNLGLADNQGNHKDPIRWALWPDWTLVKEATKLNYDENLPIKPENYQELIKCASDLSVPFPIVRVDLFNIDGKIYFNELTFFSGGGFTMSKTPVIQNLGERVDISSFKIANDAIINHTVSEICHASRN